MRTYHADIEGRMRGNDFIYTMYADNDAEAVKKFKRVYGNRVEMISLVGNNSKICIYEKPELFGRFKAEKLTSYRDLLKAYMLHVFEKEGDNFIYDNRHKSEKLSERQYEEIKIILTELQAEGRV